MRLGRPELVDLARKHYHDGKELTDEQLLAVNQFLVGNAIRSRKRLAELMLKEPRNARYAMIDSTLDLFLKAHDGTLSTAQA